MYDTIIQRLEHQIIRHYGPPSGNEYLPIIIDSKLMDIKKQINLIMKGFYLQSRIFLQRNNMKI